MGISVHHKNEMWSNIEIFIDHLDKVPLPRTEESFDVEMLEIVVEGAINYKHTAHWILDFSPEYFTDSVFLTSISALENTMEDAEDLYNLLRPILRDSMEVSQKTNKIPTLVDLEIKSKNEGYLLKYMLRVGSVDTESLNPRSAYIFTGSSLWDPIEAIEDLTTCLLTSWMVVPPRPDCIYHIEKLEWPYNHKESPQIGAWGFYCENNGTPDCDLYFNSNGTYTSLGLAENTFTASEMGVQRNIIGNWGQAWAASANKHLIDFYGFFDVAFFDGTYNFWNLDFTRAYAQYCREPEPGDPPEEF